MGPGGRSEKSLVGIQFTDIDSRRNMVRRMQLVVICILTAGDGHRISSLSTRVRKTEAMR